MQGYSAIQFDLFFYVPDFIILYLILVYNNKFQI